MYGVLGTMRLCGLAISLLVAVVVRAAQLPEFGVGWGFAYSQSNVWKWLDYLGHPSHVRVFFHPFVESTEPANNTADWRSFVSNSWNDSRAAQYGDQFGKSLAGGLVDSFDAYRAAVEDLRGRARLKGDTPATTWIAEIHPAVDWAKLFWPLSTEAIGATLKQGGVPEEYLPRLRARGIEVVGIFDLDCRELAFKATTPGESGYFEERWEQYRVMYLGGLWLSEQGVVDVELYNEPDKDWACLDQTRWIETAQINSEALQDAAADLGRPRPTLIAPSTAASFSTEYGESIFGFMNLPFGAKVDVPAFTLFDSYAWHGYGDGNKCIGRGKVDDYCVPNGHKLSTKQDLAVSKLAALGYPKMPTYISEFNCFTFRAAEELSGHVFDMPETAACVGAMIGGLLVGDNVPTSMSLHKLVQNRVPSTASGVGKNGVLFAQTSEPPFDIGGSTKAFEVYRLILNRLTSGDNQEIVRIRSPSHRLDEASSSRKGTTGWGLRHTGGRMLSIFLSHQDYKKAGKVLIDMEYLGVPPGSTISVNAVTYWNHGCITGLIGSGRGELDKVVEATYGVELPKVGFLELVVPLVSSRVVSIPASEACAVDPVRRYSDDSSDEFAVTMDPAENQTPRAILLNFNNLPPGRSTLRAILRLFVRRRGGVNNREQLTVLGFRSEGADWSRMDWDMAGIFKKNYASSDQPTIKDNIIDWDSDVQILGSVTMPNDELVADQGGLHVALDVTKAVEQEITSFALVRNIRYDAGGGLERDIPGGLHTFAGRQPGLGPNFHISDESARPQLLIMTETDDPIQPFPSRPPPPPPPFPESCAEKLDGYFHLQGTPRSCVKKGLYLSYSLKSKTKRVSIKRHQWDPKKSRFPTRSMWKIRVAQPGLYKGGFQSTIWARNRKSAKSYLASSTSSKIRVGRLQDALLRIVPVPKYKRCDRVTLVSEARLAAGRPAYLEIDAACSKLRWGLRRSKGDGYQNFWLKAAVRPDGRPTAST